MRPNLQLVKRSGRLAYALQGAGPQVAGPRGALRETSQPSQEEREVRYRYPAEEEIWEVACDSPNSFRTRVSIV